MIIGVYAQLKTKLDTMTRLEAELALVKADIDGMLGRINEVPKRKYVRKAKNGKWSYYKKQKFAAECKARWEAMTPEQRAERIRQMMAARRRNA